MSALRETSVLEPALADTLALLMPTTPTTLLLQAALLQGDAAQEAWSRWRATTEDPKAFLATDRVGIKRHLPLLYRNLVLNQVDVGRDLEPYFRAARLREELRSVRYRRFLGEAIRALHGGGIDFVIGKGVTSGETVCTDPVLRHCHDIDLMVRAAAIPAAAGRLLAAGFLPSTLAGHHAQPRFDHESGLPVELHDRLYPTPFYESPIDGLWSRAKTAQVLDVPVRVVGDADLLVQSPVHASVVPQRYSLAWIVDAVRLLGRREAEGTAIDWDTVLHIAGESRAALPLYAMYRYLSETFHAPIPEGLIQALRALASKAGRLQHLAAIDGMRASGQTGLRSIIRQSAWRSRRVIAFAALAPPAAYLRGRRPAASAKPLALLYLERPFRFAAGQVARIARRSRRGWLNAEPTEDDLGAPVVHGAATASLGAPK